MGLVMADDRNRVSVTLTDLEFQDLKGVAESLGLKPTRVVYDCIKMALPHVLQTGMEMRESIKLSQRLKAQVDWTNDNSKRKRKV